MALTEQELLDLGFSKYSTGANDLYDKLYQKCFYVDAKTKKYFINAKHYTFVHPTTGDDLGGWELSTQVYAKGTHNAININFLEDDLGEALRIIDAMFDAGLLEPYGD